MASFRCCSITQTSTPTATATATATSTSTTTPTATATATATPSGTLTRYNLTVKLAGSGSGSVSSEPDATNFVAGTVVMLTANSKAGSFFAGWSGAVTGNSNPAPLLIDADKTVTSTFTSAPTDNVNVKQSGASWTVTHDLPQGTRGYYNLLYSFTNKSKPPKTWRNVYIKVVEIRNALLLNPSDGTPGGVGEMILIPDSELPGGDNLWQSGEQLREQLVRIGILKAQWKMKLAIYGKAVSATVDAASDQVAEADDELLDLVETEETVLLETVYLPVVTN